MSPMCDRRALASSAFGAYCGKMDLFGPSIGCDLLNLIRAEALGEKDALISDKVPGALVGRPGYSPPNVIKQRQCYFLDQTESSLHRSYAWLDRILGAIAPRLATAVRIAK
ncbi:hypothetical protein N7513_011114 [Penicillium frequentans]|nr:hypothetical protein N7513_011114 [Penicillium glabrum]